jgi:hypothetical protein
VKTDGGLLVFGGGHGTRECELNERGMCRTSAGRTLAAKHVLQLTAASRVLEQVRDCLRRVLAEPFKRWFVAGDTGGSHNQMGCAGGGAIFAPREFTIDDVYVECRVVVEGHAAVMDTLIAREGWPSPHRPAVAGTKQPINTFIMPLTIGNTHKQLLTPYFIARRSQGRRRAGAATTN